MSQDQHWQPWRFDGGLSDAELVVPQAQAPPAQGDSVPLAADKPDDAGAELLRHRGSDGLLKTLVPTAPGLVLTFSLWVALAYAFFRVQPFLGLVTVWVGMAWVGGCWYLQRTPGGKAALAKFVFGFERPSAAEESLISTEWGRVCQRANVTPEAFTLWVQRTPEINAVAAGGDFVAVTTGALGLPPAYLQAVLAHEYGHHVRGHVDWAIYAWWCGLPGAKLLDLANRLLARHTAAFLGYVFVVMPIAVLVALASIVGIIFIPVLVAPVMWVISAYLSRQAELEADQVALELGYGPELIGALQQIDAQHPQRNGQTWSSSHPGVQQRIAALSGGSTASPQPSSGEQQTAAAGWYPDGASGARLRWWDGRQWTDHFHPR